jgi:hypothetical protein
MPAATVVRIASSPVEALIPGMAEIKAVAALGRKGGMTTMASMKARTAC